MIEVGIVGCGDVAFRHYLPSLAALTDRARVVACYDPQYARAQRAAARFPGALPYERYAAFLQHPGLAAILNLTPAPYHYEVTRAALDAGMHVYSEKPLAGTLEEALALGALAKQRGRLLLCAPALLATPRFKWLRAVLESGRLGRPTLAVGQLATMGPASWHGYTGDPTVFYSAGVGPVSDIGVYLLQAITGLLGPVRRIQALGGITIPERTVRTGPLAGQTIAVTTNDHMLLQLDCGNNSFAQVLASYAVPGSKAPVLEIHCTAGTISISRAHWFDASGPVDLLLRDDSALALEGWMERVAPPGATPGTDVIATGPAHFIACLLGHEAPLLTAERACHLLEIVLLAEESARDGRARELTTLLVDAPASMPDRGV